MLRAFSTAENVWNFFMASLDFHGVLCRIFFKDQTESLILCLEVLEKVSVSVSEGGKVLTHKDVIKYTDLQTNQVSRIIRRY